MANLNGFDANQVEPSSDFERSRPASTWPSSPRAR
jgi:hypothetical protein